MVKLLHSGDLGDIIAALPILKQLGGGTVAITAASAPGGPRADMEGERFDGIAPLLRAQPYVHAVQWVLNPSDVTHDLTHFRVNKWQPGETLTEWQARCLGIKMGPYENGWLTLPTFKPNALTVMARSSRYHNYFFPWDELIRFNPGAVFVGTEKEHADLEEETKRKIIYHPTKDLLALAELIAGARVTICNQSCPFWIAAGLGVPLIQETYEQHPNSIVRQKNAIYTLTGPESRTLIFRLYPPSTRRQPAEA